MKLTHPFGNQLKITANVIYRIDRIKTSRAGASGTVVYYTDDGRKKHAIVREPFEDVARNIGENGQA
jgi:hypothetical protein